MEQTRWQQIEKLYNAVLEQMPADRARFLEENCAGDAELLAEVRSLLNSHEQTDSFLVEPEFDLGLKILAKPAHVLKKDREFGNYKILDFLGRGGMGEVYLAEDTRLKRFIALKVLPADVASDRERIRRFMQEARAASALNHPNILTIYDIGESEGWHFIASEFVEGWTLRERLKGEEPLTLVETVEVAVQIATALNAAHKAGIVHRDIKPENVMLRSEDGIVKVLDFGLAKLTENLEGQNRNEDFISTDPGMVMGTVAYMSPEQVRGKKTDARSDIWSFGVVLYEMLTGNLPFEGDTASDKIAAILTAEPILPEDSPLENTDEIRQIIGKALRKDPAERYQMALEMAEDLKKIRLDADPVSKKTENRMTGFEQIPQTGETLKKISTSEIARHSWQDTNPVIQNKNKFLIALAGLLIIALGGAFIFFYLTDYLRLSREPLKITRVFDTGKTIGAAISPDGKYIAHAVTESGKQSLWIKHLATNSNVQLMAPAQAGFYGLTFSRDGSYIYYIQSNTLHQIPVLGGDARKILENVSSPVSFSPDGRQFTFIRYLPEDENALFIANTDGSGEKEIARRSKPEAFGGGGDSWSPDGKFIAGSVSLKGEPYSGIVLTPVSGGEAKFLSRQKWRQIEQLVWLPDGSGLLGTADAETGEPLTHVWFFPANGEDARRVTTDLNQYTGISLSANASQFITIHWQNRQNIWLLPNGKSEEARIVSSNIHANYRFIALTPDGRIVFPSNENAGGNRDIWIMNPDGSNARQLTGNTGENTSGIGNILPCVTGDGRYIVFASNRADAKTYHIWRMNMDGNDPVQLTNGDGERGPVCAPDSQTVYFNSGGPNEGPEKSTLWKTTIDGGEPVQLTDYPTGWKDVSPDGKFIALRFKSDKDSPFQLGIIPATGGKPVKVFDYPKQNPQLRWKPDGSAITYFKTENGVSNFWEQPVNGEPARQVSKFSAELILGFGWSKNGDLICSRGYEARDPVLISNFR